MSRAIAPSTLRKRAHYPGFDYRQQRAVTRSGTDWQHELAGLRLEHNGDCLAAYRGAQLQFEIYDGHAQRGA